MGGSIPAEFDQTAKIRDALTVFTPTLTTVGSHTMTAPAFRVSGATACIAAFTLQAGTYTPTELNTAGTTKYYPLFSLTSTDVQKVLSSTDISSWSNGQTISVGTGISIRTGQRQPASSTNLWNNNFTWFLIKHSSSTYYLILSHLAVSASSTTTTVTIPFDVYLQATTLMSPNFLPSDLY